MRLALFLIAMSVAAVACGKTQDTTQTGSPAPVPAMTGSPSYAGPATLVRGTDGPSVYGTIANGSFKTCANMTVVITANDTIYHNGTCHPLAMLSTAASLGAKAIWPDATVSGMSVDGDTAIASYTHAGASGQILLTHSALGWTAVTSVKRAFTPADNIGIDPQRLQTLQARVRANLTKP